MKNAAQLQLYSARIESGLNQLMFAPPEEPIRTEVELELIQTLDSVGRIIREDVPILASAIQERALDPLRLTTLIESMNPIRPTDPRTALRWNTASTLFLARTVIQQPFASLALMGSYLPRALLYSIAPNLARHVLKGRTTPGDAPQNDLGTELAHLMIDRVRREQILPVGLFLTAVFATTLAYCSNFAGLQERWHQSGLDRAYKLECTSGRFGQLRVGGDDGLVFHPAFAIDWLLQLSVELARVVRALYEGRGETNTEYGSLLGRAVSNTAGWFTVRFAPYQQAVLQLAQSLLRPFGLSIEIAPEWVKREMVQPYAPSDVASIFQILTNAYTPLVIQNFSEALYALTLGNRQLDWTSWLDATSRLEHHLGHAHGYRPQGTERGLRLIQTMLYPLAQAAALRSAPPYNPLNQIDWETTPLRQAGLMIPFGILESDALLQDAKARRETRLSTEGDIDNTLDYGRLVEVTNSFHTQTHRNQYYRMVQVGVAPLVYRTLESSLDAPFPTGHHARDAYWREVRRNDPISTKQMLEREKALRSDLRRRSDFASRVERLSKQHWLLPLTTEYTKSLMSYETLQMYAPDLLPHLKEAANQYYREFGYAPNTKEGLYRAGAVYATALMEYGLYDFFNRQSFAEYERYAEQHGHTKAIHRLTQRTMGLHKLQLAELMRMLLYSPKFRADVGLDTNIHDDLDRLLMAIEGKDIESLDRDGARGSSAGIPNAPRAIHALISKVAGIIREKGNARAKALTRYDPAQTQAAWEYYLRDAIETIQAEGADGAAPSYNLGYGLAIGYYLATRMHALNTRIFSDTREQQTRLLQIANTLGQYTLEPTPKPYRAPGLEPRTTLR